MSEYKKYLRGTSRVGGVRVSSLLDNDAVYVTAKVDSSNGCVYWSEEGGRGYGRVACSSFPMQRTMPTPCSAEKRH